MKTNAITASLLALTLLLPLAACSNQSDQDNHASSDLTQAAKEVQKQTSPSVIGAQIQKGIAQAKQELLTQDIDVRGVTYNRASKPVHDENDSRPKAVITPQGEFVVAGKTVEATPEQHALLLDYRQQIVGIAEAGMDIGASSADMGVDMARTAIVGALTGKSDKDIEASIKPQTDKIEAAAMQLCKRMPALLASQQKLAAGMPAFQPYATMTQKDVDDCARSKDENGKPGVAVFSN